MSETQRQTMKRSMMQVYVRGSVEAVELYQRAFNAELGDLYFSEDKTVYLHAELNAYGQIIAVAEALPGEIVTGNAMQFCFHFGKGGEAAVWQAYEALREGVPSAAEPAPCDYSPCQFCIIDKFGVSWCIFV